MTQTQEYEMFLTYACGHPSLAEMALDAAYEARHRERARSEKCLACESRDQALAALERCDYANVSESFETFIWAALNFSEYPEQPDWSAALIAALRATYDHTPSQQGAAA